jgi:hypothetical protein
LLEIFFTSPESNEISLFCFCFNTNTELEALHSQNPLAEMCAMDIDSLFPVRMYVDRDVTFGSVQGRI